MGDTTVLLSRPYVRGTTGVVSVRMTGGCRLRLGIGLALLWLAFRVMGAAVEFEKAPAAPSP